MPQSTTQQKPEKPRPDFPLFPHAAGVWAKKVRGQLKYFGPWADPQAALQKWLDERLAFSRSLGLEMLKVCVGIRLYPHTPLARQAVEDGVVSPDDDLLVSRFYIRPGLEGYTRQVDGEM